MSALTAYSLKNLGNRALQFRQIMFDDSPDQIIVNTKVPMNKDVSCSDHF